MTDISDSNKEIVDELLARFDKSVIMRVDKNVAGLQSMIQEYDYVVFVKDSKRDLNKDPLITKEGN